MKQLNLKIAVVGFLIGTIGMTTVFAAGEIRSASFSSARVYFYGREVPLENQLVLITNEGETNARLYMPMRELLEFMNFIVEWDGENNSVNLTMRGGPGNTEPGVSAGTQSGYVQPRAWDGRGVYDGGYDEHPSELTLSEAGRRAVDIMQRTGNWSFIEPYLPYISNADIQRMVDIFNSRQNTSRQRRASDYMN